LATLAPDFWTRQRRSITDPAATRATVNVIADTLPAVVEFATRSPDEYGVVSLGRVKFAVGLEMVHGTVFWAWKSMYLCLTLPKEEVIKTGMKDFTYRNYSRFAQNYSTKELEDRLRELKEMYHRAHRGEGDFEVLLERFILNI
jgi:hypothetical protein